MSEQEHTTIFPQLSESSWLLEIDGFDPALELTIEAVCAWFNGYSVPRAAIEEGSVVSRPATFIAGVFNTPAQPQTPELDEPISEIVVAPNWSRLRITAEGQLLSLDQAELLDQRRVLDLRQGFLLREWRVRDSAGRITSLRSLRFASLDDPHALVQLLTLTPENYSGRITLESLLDGRVTNENNTVHLAPVEAAALTPNPSPAAAGEGAESVSLVGGEGGPLLSPPLPSQREGGRGGEGQLLTIRTLQSGYVL